MTEGGGLMVAESVLWTLWAPAFAGDSKGYPMGSGFRWNEGGGVTGVGWRNAIQIPAFAGMTALGAGMTAGGAGYDWGEGCERCAGLWGIRGIAGYADCS